MKLGRSTFLISLVIFGSANLALSQKSFGTSQQSLESLQDGCYNGRQNKYSRAEIEKACRALINLPQAVADRPEAYNVLGLAAYRDADYPTAIKVFDEALVQFPDYKNIIFNRGLALSWSKNYIEAIKSFERVQKIDPEFVGTASSLGDCHDGLGHYDEALEYFKLAVIEAPHEELNYKLLGFHQIGLGKPKDAIENLESAARINPEECPYLQQAAFAAYLAGDLKTAKIDLEKARKVEPLNPYNPLIRYFITKAEHGDAIAVLENDIKSIDVTKSWAGSIIQCLLGKITPEQLFKDGVAEDVSTNGRHIESYYYLGENELLKNNKSQALAYFKEATKYTGKHYILFWANLARLRELESPPAKSH